MKPVGAAATLSGELEDIRFEVVEQLDRLKSLAVPWGELMSTSAAPAQVFQRHDWVTAWVDAFLNGDGDAGTSLAVVVAWRGEGLIAALPLCVTRSLGVRLLGWAGLPLAQYGDVVVREGEDAARLVATMLDLAIAQTGADVLHLRKVREDATIRSALTSRGAECTASFRAPYMDLASASCAETYKSRQSSRTRKSRRRNLRQLGSLGHLRCVTYPAGGTAATIAREIIASKRAKLVASGDVLSALHDPRFADAFALLAARTCVPEACLITRLYVDDTPVAAEIGVTFKGLYIGHVCDFDERYRKYGPGIILIEKMVDQAYARGWTRIDHLAPETAYKASLSDNSVGVDDFAIRLSAAGGAYVLGMLQTVHPAARRINVHAREAIRWCRSAVNSLAIAGTWRRDR